MFLHSFQLVQRVQAVTSVLLTPHVDLSKYMCVVIRYIRLRDASKLPVNSVSMTKDYFLVFNAHLEIEILENCL